MPQSIKRRTFNRILWGAAAAIPAASLGRAALQDGSQPRVDGRRLNNSLQQLSRFGRNEQGGVSRVAYSPADLQGREYVQGLMNDAGLQAEIDAAGNLVGRRPGRRSGLMPLMAGSHIDTVPEGGNYDGIVGALGAIEAAQTLHESGLSLDRPLEIIIFSNEEGGQVGARALAGRLQPQDLDRRSHSGLTLREGIAAIGGDPRRLEEVRRRPGEVFAYLELHIEQGPLLDSEAIDIGVVEGIVGIHRWMVTVKGFANHAGTTPMDRRQDALLAGARFVDAVNRQVTAVPGRQVGTVGWIEALPGAPNVVPGQVRLTLEMRDLDWEKIDRLFARLEQTAVQIGEQTGTEFSFEEIYNNPPRLTDRRIQGLISQAARELGFSQRPMPSGAGHDAQSISHIAPIGMIFVPSRDGISHSGREFTSPQDVANGADLLLHSLLALDGATL